MTELGHTLVPDFLIQNGSQKKTREDEEGK